MYHHAPLMEFRTRVDWDERQKMLRVEFPADIHTLTARYDIAFGNVEHPNPVSYTHLDVYKRQNDGCGLRFHEPVLFLGAEIHSWPVWDWLNPFCSDLDD